MSRFITPRVYKNPGLIAEQMLAKCGFPRLGNGVAIDVERIVTEFCGFELMHIEGLELGGRPVLGLFAHNLNAVLVENNCYDARKRFTIAHELGHAQLEYDHGNAASLFDLDEPELFGCTEEDELLDSMNELKSGLRRKKEIRANKFAANLLMPEGLVKEVWRQMHGNLETVSGALFVSKEALGYRLQDLNLS
jgi:Zn-dependent peptidase ImmA (M78 family)